MKTEILKIKGDWEEVVDDCRATVKKPPLGHEPSASFKLRILLAEHSPIRDILVKFRWKNIPYWVAMHWKTHHWESRVDSQRNDRQCQYDRENAPQRTPVTFTGDANLQHLIDTMRKRLCHMASGETRRYAESLKQELFLREPEAAYVLVPNCVYRCGCPEMTTCGWYHMACEKVPEMASTDLKERYDAYNKYHFGILLDGDVRGAE